MTSRALTLILSLLLSACVSTENSGEQRQQTEASTDITSPTEQVSATDLVPQRTEAVADDPYYAPINPPAEAEPVAVTGSIFNSATSRSLYSYVPHFNLGDTITVVLEEEAAATKSASSTLGKSTSYKLDPIQAPGGEFKIANKVIQLDMNQESDFDGSADANQQHRLSGKITVSVVDVLTNGNLVVRGEKWLVINNGNEFIRLTGIVRPKDVAMDNSIGSFQLANARIEFSGTGDQAKTQTQGWLASFFNSESWPF